MLRDPPWWPLAASPAQWAAAVPGAPSAAAAPGPVCEPTQTYPNQSWTSHTQTLHGTAIYAYHLGWCQGGQCGGIYGSPMQCLGYEL